MRASRSGTAHARQFFLIVQIALASKTPKQHCATGLRAVGIGQEHGAYGRDSRPGGHEQQLSFGIVPQVKIARRSGKGGCVTFVQLKKIRGPWPVRNEIEQQGYPIGSTWSRGDGIRSGHRPPCSGIGHLERNKLARFEPDLTRLHQPEINLTDVMRELPDGYNLRRKTLHRSHDATPFAHLILSRELVEKDTGGLTTVWQRPAGCLHLRGTVVLKRNSLDHIRSPANARWPGARRFQCPRRSPAARVGGPVQ